MAAQPSVIDIKKSFLSTQIRTLNAPLELSRGWRDNAPTPEDAELKDRLVQEVLQRCTLGVSLRYILITSC